MSPSGGEEFTTRARSGGESGSSIAIVVGNPMLKLTRLDHRTIAINPTLVAWLEETPDTVVCMVGGQRMTVRERIDEVIDAFVAFYERVGRTPTVVPEGASTFPETGSRYPSRGDG